MAFMKLATPTATPSWVWVNLDLVRTMVRLDAWAGTPYSDQNDDGTWRDYIAGAKPERTQVCFGPSDEDVVPGSPDRSED